MRILIVTESHRRGLAEVFRAEKSGWKVLTVRVGRTLPIVRAAFMARLREIRRFRPDCVVLHVGHIDVVPHTKYNTENQHIKYFFPAVIAFLKLIKELLTGACVMYSSLFPRSLGQGMDQEQKYKYNKLAGRYGVRAKAVCTEEGIPYILNGTLWHSAKKGQEKAELFDEGRLHLSKDGRVAVVRRWIVAIESVVS
jgi:lysophospholipase L1-like esterase